MTRYSRRQFGVLLGAVASLSLVDCMPRGRNSEQAAATPRIARFVHGSLTAADKHRIDALLDGLRDLGYVDGENISIQWLFGADRPGVPLTTLAKELVDLGVRAIITSYTPPLVAAAEATRTVPIVACLPHRSLQDLGLVDSLAHPAGNVTGIEGKDEVYAKLVELIHDAIPSMTSLAYVRNPATPGTARPMGYARAAANQLGVDFIELQARNRDELEFAYASAVAAGASGLVMATDTAFPVASPLDVAVAAPLRYKLPTIYTVVESYIEYGGLMAYGPDITATHRRAASFVDKILKGVPVAELPVEQSMQFEFAINMPTAQALGLSIPDDLLLQATQIMQ
jgi:putative tryptophan/tyrosine transport system substrate-binding protein